MFVIAPDQIQLISDFVIGILLPFIMQLFATWLPSHPFARYLSILGVSLVTGAFIAFGTGLTTAGDVFQSFIVIATTAQTIYVAFLKKQQNPIDIQY